MDKQQNKIVLKPQPNEQQKTLVLLGDNEGKKMIIADLYRRFSMYKVFGKEPESFENYIAVIVNDCGNFPSEKVLLAIQTHSQRQDEPPTSANIIDLIKRNGKPPLRESDIIAIRKKDGQDRTSEDWKTLEEWDNQQKEGWGSDYEDDKKYEATLQENIRLREQIKALQQENARAWQEAGERKIPAPTESAYAPLTRQQKINNTVAAYRAEGRSQADIKEFLNSVSATENDSTPDALAELAQ